jgi:hypothetical protein
VYMRTIVMVHPSDGETWKMFNSFDANSFSSYTSFHRKRKIIEELLGKKFLQVHGVGVQHLGCPTHGIRTSNSTWSGDQTAPIYSIIWTWLGRTKLDESTPDPPDLAGGLGIRAHRRGVGHVKLNRGLTNHNEHP